MSSKFPSSFFPLSFVQSQSSHHLGFVWLVTWFFFSDSMPWYYFHHHFWLPFWENMFFSCSNHLKQIQLYLILLSKSWQTIKLSLWRCFFGRPFAFCLWHNDMDVSWHVNEMQSISYVYQICRDPSSCCGWVWWRGPCPSTPPKRVVFGMHHVPFSVSVTGSLNNQIWRTVIHFSASTYDVEGIYPEITGCQNQGV